MTRTDLINRLKQVEQLVGELRSDIENYKPPQKENQQTPKPEEQGQSSNQDSKKEENAAPEEKNSQTDQQQADDQTDVKQDDGQEESVPEGEVGVFDGEFVEMGNDKRYQVPPNYASKSMLVKGDKLELLEHGDHNKFKIVDQIEREETVGILTKKENQWIVLTDNGEFRVISASIRFYNGEIGDQIELVLPKGYKENPPEWAAVKSVIKADENKEKEEESANTTPDNSRRSGDDTQKKDRSKEQHTSSDSSERKTKPSQPNGASKEEEQKVSAEKKQEKSREDKQSPAPQAQVPPQAEHNDLTVEALNAETQNEEIEVSQEIPELR